MKSMLKFIAAAVISAATLTACGGHYKKPDAVVVAQPDYKVTDTVVGTGTLAVAVKPVLDTTTGVYTLKGSQLVTIIYTGYIYDATKADGKGAVFLTSLDAGATAPAFTLGAGQPIAGSTALLGLDQAVDGMRVGGKRTVLLPASLAYGASSFAERDVTRVSTGATIKYPALPAHSPMVFDIELVAITVLPNIDSVPPEAGLYDLTAPVTGTGTLLVEGKYATVNYSGYLYDGTRASRKGVRFDSNVYTTTTPAPVLSFQLVPASTADNSPTRTVIKGFNEAVRGMAVGGKRTVVIPPELGYGSVAQTSIPANSTLIFDIELLYVTDAAKTTVP